MNRVWFSLCEKIGFISFCPTRERQVFQHWHKCTLTKKIYSFLYNIWDLLISYALWITVSQISVESSVSVCWDWLYYPVILSLSCARTCEMPKAVDSWVPKCSVPGWEALVLQQCLKYSRQGPCSAFFWLSVNISQNMSRSHTKQLFYHSPMP